MTHDLVIRGGTLATAEKSFRADVGIQGERIAEIGTGLSAKRTIDANGRLVLPGGVDSHCHIEQLSSMGVMTADDFYSATVSAAHGGTTTVIPFCAQHRQDNLQTVLRDYHERARTKAVIDYGFHLIVANPDEPTLREHLPEAVGSGVRSFKIFMTYERTASRCWVRPARNICFLPQRTSTSACRARSSAAARRRVTKRRRRRAGKA